MSLVATMDLISFIAVIVALIFLLWGWNRALSHYTKKVMGKSGIGLGLAVAWNVVQDHKGHIGVTTDENGTTFELFFPITRRKISAKDLTTAIEGFKGNGEAILVVDDVESQRDISCRMLETLGYRTKEVSSGEEAVEYLKKNTVDLILLDMIMDLGINGRETYGRIKRFIQIKRPLSSAGSQKPMR